MTDISTIKPIERTFDILHPATKEPIGVSITLMSPNDPRLDRLRDQVAQQQLAAQSKGKTEKIDVVKERRRKILHAATVSWKWEGDANWKGEKPEPTLRVFSEIAEEASWFIDQIDAEFAETESFFQNAEPN